MSMVSFARLAPANHAALSTLRRSASDWLAGELGSNAGEVIADLTVVLTELAANVIDHTDSETVAVELALADDGFVTLVVANDGPVSAVPPAELWGKLDEGDRGRGLRLVKSFCDEILIGGDERHTTISCRRRLA